MFSISADLFYPFITGTHLKGWPEPHRAPLGDAFWSLYQLRVGTPSTTFCSGTSEQHLGLLLWMLYNTQLKQQNSADIGGLHQWSDKQGQLLHNSHSNYCSTQTLEQLHLTSPLGHSEATASCPCHCHLPFTQCLSQKLILSEQPLY